MTKRATVDLMDMLHRATAEELIDIIRNGVPIFDAEGNDTGRRAKPAASYLAAAIKFLKDNDITAEMDSNKSLSDLRDAIHNMPDFDADDADEYGLPQ